MFEVCLLANNYMLQLSTDSLAIWSPIPAIPRSVAVQLSDLYERVGARGGAGAEAGIRGGAGARAGTGAGTEAGAGARSGSLLRGSV